MKQVREKERLFRYDGFAIHFGDFGLALRGHGNGACKPAFAQPQQTPVRLQRSVLK